MAKTKISSFTSKGTRAPGTVGTGKLARLGMKVDGVVYQHPRVKLDPLAGRSVRVTNPTASGPARNQRTAGLGMGNVGSVGRTRDIP